MTRIPVNAEHVAADRALDAMLGTDDDDPLDAGADHEAGRDDTHDPIHTFDPTHDAPIGELERRELWREKYGDEP